jgi:hypothetical protein
MYLNYYLWVHYLDSSRGSGVLLYLLRVVSVWEFRKRHSKWNSEINKICFKDFNASHDQASKQKRIIRSCYSEFSSQCVRLSSRHPNPSSSLDTWSMTWTTATLELQVAKAMIMTKYGLQSLSWARCSKWASFQLHWAHPCMRWSDFCRQRLPILSG